MSKPLTSTTAAEIAAAIPGILRDHASRVDFRDWSSIDSYRAFVALLRSGTAWRVGANTVVAMVSGPDADVWGYVVANAFDDATQDYDLPNAHIRPVTDIPRCYTLNLVCDCGGACTLPAE
jgi:hypothetical protein